MKRFLPLGIAAAALMAALSPGALADLLVYPVNIANPRVPCVPPVADGARGRRMAIDADFRYPLAPFASLANGGKATLYLRDDPSRPEKTLLKLIDGDRSIAIAVAPASAGRLVGLELRRGDHVLSAVTTKMRLSSQWTRATLSIDATNATLTMEGNPPVTLDLRASLAPSEVEVSVAHVEELTISGDGAFVLDWEHGYAATVSPGSAATRATTRLMGFDSYFVSDQPNRRDTPVLVVSNPAPHPVSVSIRFHLESEVAHRSLDWTQAVTAPARSAATAAIAFPAGLTSDIYHLRETSVIDGGETVEEKHFVYASRMAGGRGSARFGLHDSDRKVFGFWPDALPVSLAHDYANWGYIVGPAWLKDDHGGFGMDPDTDPAQWNWDKRVEWITGQGLTPYICINGNPWFEWMREPGFDSAHAAVKYPWGALGGKPDDRRYRQFVHALAERYKGRVSLYEIQNEPNAFPPGGGIDPAVYVAILKAAYQEIHAVDPKATVYGICGTGDFIPWMTKVFELGGGQYMDAVSFHTYVTPRLPEESALPSKLAQARALAAKYGKTVLLNSETGTYVALREDVDRPIPADRLDNLIARGTPTLSVSHGWPNYALDETKGSLSIVRNAVYNFLAGAKAFTFFGWNSEWPSANWYTKSADDCFAIVSATKDGVRTPSLYTLAIGVLTTQLESALIETATPINDGDIRGGIFRTEGGGATAVVWSTAGQRTAVFSVQGQDVQAVSLFGQPAQLPRLSPKGGLVQIELTDQPVYVRVRHGALTEQRSPIHDITIVPMPDGGHHIHYNLTNDSTSTWSGNVTYHAPAGWSVTPSKGAFEIASKGTTSIDAVARQAIASASVITINAELTTPNGGTYAVPFQIRARPSLSVPRTTATRGDSYDALPGDEKSIGKPEQVVIGRPPALASLQETQYWQGASELSARVKTAWTADGLTIGVKVHDVNFAPPEAWPGVGGSCVELFLDFRKPDQGLGAAPYGPGVYQIILKPAANKTDPPAVWIPAGAPNGLPNATARGGVSADGDYWLTYTLPWASVGLSPKAGAPFGFDLSIDGPPAGAAARKTQMALFGSAANSVDASGFGLASLGN
ncbi:MAG: hypothetical protein P4L33_11865 [Capsulimonadaceae bacterium]|nr:hypothetical protein [Capsulimonadaceae bacterium]